MQRLGRLGRLTRTPVRDRRRVGGVPTLGKAYIAFDGVTQHAVNTDEIAPAMFPGGPGPCVAHTICFWHRGVDQSERNAIPLYASTTCTGEANPAIAIGYFRPIGGVQWRVLSNRVRTTPSLTVAGLLYLQTLWPDGTFSDPTEWRLAAMVVTPTSHIIWDRGAFRPTTTPTSYSDYNNTIGKYFGLNGQIKADGSLFPGTGMALDYRAPSVHMSALDATQLAAIEAAGPTGDHSAAAGWWPGDGDTYPVWTNRGTAGSAWDLTLKNGSQAMIREA